VFSERCKRVTNIKQPCDEGVVRSARESAQCSKATGLAVLAVAILGSSMTFVDGTVVNVALPVLGRQLGATAAELQWIVEAYMLFLASLILVGGALGDRWGRRRMFVAGTLIFASASAWCGLAPDVTHLIAARAAQGAGAALLVPGSLALISANFSRGRRGRAIGTWAGFTSIAAGLGPVLGGWLVQEISWRWIFFINLPLAAAVVAIAWWRVPESRGVASTAPIDWRGAALAVAGLAGLVFGLIEGGSEGFSERRVFLSLASGGAALAAFVLVEWRARYPMVPPVLFRSRTFTGVNLLTLFLYCAAGATMFVLPFNLIQVQGYSVVEAAAALLPFVVVMSLLSRWAGGLMDRYGSRLPLTVGPVIASVGFALFTRAAGGGAYWTTVLPAILVMSVGFAVSVAPLTTTVMTSVEAGQAGLASGINNAVSRLATLIAVAVAGLISKGSFETGLVGVGWMSAALALAGGMSAAFLVQRGTGPQGPDASVPSARQTTASSVQ
jgi:EmrB/QacA subfamily drug resistance transporter